MRAAADTCAIIGSLVTPIQARQNDVVEALRRLDHTIPISRAYDALEIPLCTGPILDRPEHDRQTITITLKSNVTVTWETRVSAATDQHVFIETTRITAAGPETYDRLASGLGAVHAFIGYVTRRMHAIIGEDIDTDAREHGAPSARLSAPARPPNNRPRHRPRHRLVAHAT